MKHGDAELDDWEISAVEIDGEPGLHLFLEGTVSVSELYFRRNGSIVKPCRQNELAEGTGWANLMDSEVHLVQQILERRGYRFPDTME